MTLPGSTSLLRQTLMLTMTACAREGTQGGLVATLLAFRGLRSQGRVFQTVVSGVLMFYQGKARGTQGDQELLNQRHSSSNPDPKIYQQSDLSRVNEHTSRKQEVTFSDP